MQLIYPLIFPQTITLFQTDDDNYADSGQFLGIFNTFLDALDGSYCTYTAFGETGNLNGVDPTYPDPAAGGFKGNLECGVYKVCDAAVPLFACVIAESQQPTNVISISYGEQESDLPHNYQQRQCNE